MMIAILILLRMASAQITGVSPTSGVYRIVSDSASGPIGPSIDAYSVTISGTGSVTWTNTCFNGIWTNVPGASGTLPLTIKVKYAYAFNQANCVINFSGASSSTGTFTATHSLIPNARATVHTDLYGVLLSTKATCTYPSVATGTPYRSPSGCAHEEGVNMRPGYGRLIPLTAATYTDRTYGARVTNQGNYTRDYVNGNQISYNRDYVVLWDRAGARAVLHRVNASDGSADLVVSGPGGVCNIGSSANIGLGTTAATATVGFCQSGSGAGQRLIKKFSFTGGTITDLGTIYTHTADMNGGLWGTGQAGMDGWMSIFDATQICVLNWFDAAPTATCITPPYTTRNATISPYPSRSTGLHYVWQASDTPNRTTIFAFNPVTKSLTLQAQDIPVFDAPGASTTGATWSNGTCTNGVDCATAGHHNVGWWGGEPYDCGTGRGRIQSPMYAEGGGCVRGYGWNTATGIDVDAVGGPVMPAVSAVSEYFAPSRGQVSLTTQGYGGQGLVPAWRISSCTGSAGTVTCTLAASGTTAAAWTAGSTPIYVDGFTATADRPFNGRFTLSAKTSNTFSYACSTCTGTTATDKASVATDTTVETQVPGRAGQGAIVVCRNGLGHCRTLAQPLNVSWGTGSPAIGTGTWAGALINAPGYQALNFPTIGQWGERVCWVTDFGHLENLYVACAETGRADLGLAPFDLDEKTPDSCFDRKGHCLDVATVAATTIDLKVKPTNPSFTCTVEASTRRDFGTIAATATLTAPVTLTGSASLTGLTTATQYHVRAKCGLAAGEVWDYAVLPIRTK